MENDNYTLKLIGSRIREERLLQKKSQEEIAIKASTSLCNISNTELGKTDLRITTFIKIIEALGVSADYILRPNIPEVEQIYHNEFAKKLEGCTQKEIETIFDLIDTVKKSFR